MLKTINLEINESKLEKYKYLGSLCNSTTNIIKRKVLTNTNYNILENLFKSKHLLEDLKIKLFTTHMK